MSRTTPLDSLRDRRKEMKRLLAKRSLKHAVKEGGHFETTM